MMRAAGFLLAIGLVVAATGCGGGSSAKTARLVIMDQNVLHGFVNEDAAAEPFDRFPERIQLIAGALAEAQPDIVLLQEVVGDPGADYPNVRAELLAALGSEYTAVFGNFLGGAIDGDGLGQMTLTRLQVISSENRTVSEIRSAVRVTVQTDEGPLDIYNVHLEGTDDDDPQFAVDEITKVMDFIEDTRSGGPVILAGDFNAVPSDPAIRALLEAGFVDVLDEAGDATCEEAGDPGCTNSTIPLGDNPDKLADRRIDMMFVLPGDDVRLEPGDAELFNHEPIDIGEGHTLWASDHIGVRAVLELKGK